MGNGASGLYGADEHLRAEDVLDIKSMCERGLDVNKISRRLGRSNQTVRRVRDGEYDGCQALDDTEHLTPRVALRSMLLGRTPAEIARTFGVSVSVAHDAVAKGRALELERHHERIRLSCEFKEELSGKVQPLDADPELPGAKSWELVHGHKLPLRVVAKRLNKRLFAVLEDLAAHKVALERKAREHLAASHRQSEGKPLHCKDGD